MSADHEATDQKALEAEIEQLKKEIAQQADTIQWMHDLIWKLIQEREEMEKNSNLVSLTSKIKEHLETLRTFNATPESGVTRLPFTKEAKEAVDYIIAQMEAIGMTVHVNNIGAVIGRLEGEDPDAPAIMMGSHYDSVKNGGAYDGIAGVVTAIETARLIKESGQKLRYPLEVIATNDEEGICYGVCCMTPRAMLGQIDAEFLKGIHDEHGESFYDASRRFGVDPDRLDECLIDPSKVKCFIEIHIEQGPVLDKKKIQLGLVEHIAGLERYSIEMIGESNHAGSTPMDMRKDPVEAASMVVSQIPGWAREEGKGTVATVGAFTVHPNALNTIADKVTWSIDCRSAYKECVRNVITKMENELKEVEKKTGVSHRITKLVDCEPGVMDQKLLDLLEESCKAKGYSYQRMLSGASHDAHIFCEKMDTVMIFVPSKNGISHSPEEHSEYIDLARATDIAADTILKLNK